MYVPVLPTGANQNNATNTPRKCMSTKLIPTLLLCLTVCCQSGTQEDQNDTDEKERKKAMNELVASWMDRLQLISVIVSIVIHYDI